MKPILFNTDMVRAILNNRKTVTRRVVKPQPSMPYSHEVDGEWFWTSKDSDDDMMDWWPSYETGLRPPYRPGDILYVRETWSPVYVRPKRYLYKADADAGKGEGAGLPIKWRPSIHMPREAARLFLRVMDVKVERLQDMQPYDIAFEGFRRQRNFIALWDSTIKPEDRALYGWEANPWVWVIEFERITKEEAG